MGVHESQRRALPEPSALKPRRLSNTLIVYLSFLLFVLLVLIIVPLTMSNANSTPAVPTCSTVGAP
jgi:hypothetical protein